MADDFNISTTAVTYVELLAEMSAKVAEMSLSVGEIDTEEGVTTLFTGLAQCAGGLALVDFVLRWRNTEALLRLQELLGGLLEQFKEAWLDVVTTPRTTAIHGVVKSQKRAYDNRTTKLSPAEVLEIYDQYQQERPRSAIASQFGIGLSAVYNIGHRKTWIELLDKERPE